MVKNLTRFHVYLPSQGKFQGVNGLTCCSVRDWPNQDICNSAGGAFDCPTTLAQALGSGRGSLARRIAMSFATS